MKWAECELARTKKPKIKPNQAEMEGRGNVTIFTTKHNANTKVFSITKGAKHAKNGFADAPKQLKIHMNSAEERHLRNTHRVLAETQEYPSHTQLLG